MTLKRLAYIGGSITLVLFATSVLFLGNQRQANADSFADDINCEIFERLVAAGSPIPPDLAEACSGGGGEESVDACPNEETDAGVQESGPCNGDDICPEDDGIQTTTPCPSDDDTEGGGGGDDTEEDTDTSTPSSGGGGGGGGGSGGGSVLGATTGVPQGIACDQYMTAFIKPGGDNDQEQVYRLQALLTTFEGAGLEMSGMYDEASIAAVHAFQTKYAEEILAPWGITQSTGFVYLTTRKKMNEVYCDRGLEFPLSEEEQQIIERAKTAPVVAESVVKEEEPEEAVQVIEVEEANDEDTPVVDTPTRSFRDFFRGLFDRFR